MRLLVAFLGALPAVAFGYIVQPLRRLKWKIAPKRYWGKPAKKRPYLKARIYQWGRFENWRWGTPERGDPEKVAFTDYRSYIRFNPNPGFRIAGKHWCLRGRHG
jgi:hypothetical protein